MAYFHSRFVTSRGGKKYRSMRKVVPETLQELIKLGVSYPDHVTYTLPPRGKNCWSSRSLPIAYVDYDQIGILEAIESVEVGNEYLHMLTWLLRKEFYERYGDGSKAEWFKRELTGNMSRLLRSGEWVDEPEASSLINLNVKLGKIDLGRRSDLKLASIQSGELKYDPDRVSVTETAPVERAEATYEMADTVTRAEMRILRPWLAKKWIEQYGE